ncbi:MAG: multiple resistance and pH regulation protein F [Kosmotoga sp.]|uniref:monovalent cation/H+ antiporter complex subunit F n=1 Tax=Kosmotoga sp. TaxID=1955248 RepID=UPI001DFCEE1F|nr:monovalent cation/H+ antiporter complex subunit F [Kosmotoga sp.]MBO8167279.1 multiple resistance and pH regulation protein F [Kosmotoga sp.]
MSRTLRWFIGLLLVIVFIVFNFAIIEVEFLVRLINILLMCTLMVIFRVIFGPSAADRVVAVDIFGIIIVGLLALVSLFTGASFFLDIAMAWALQSFIVSLALAKFLEGRHMDD